MSVGFISPGTRRMVQHAFARYIFDHLYARTTSTQVGTDPYGMPIEGPPMVVDNLPCHYDENPSQALLAGGGVIELNRPVISVPDGDPLDDGAMVGNVRTRDGTVLLEGPYVVETSWAIAPGEGGVMTKVCTLRQPTEIVPEGEA